MAAVAGALLTTRRCTDVKRALARGRILPQNDARRNLPVACIPRRAKWQLVWRYNVQVGALHPGIDTVVTIGATLTHLGLNPPVAVAFWRRHAFALPKRQTGVSGSNEFNTIWEMHGYTHSRTLAG